MASSSRVEFEQTLMLLFYPALDLNNPIFRIAFGRYMGHQSKKIFWFQQNTIFVVLYLETWCGLPQVLQPFKT